MARGTPDPTLKKLSTERRNPASARLDQKPALDLVRIINRQDATVATAVGKALPQIAEVIEVIASQLRRGGRLIYVGSGTSGRIAALDAAECPPTFGTPPRMVQFVIAGGRKALSGPLETSEDSRESGRKDMAKRKPGPKDVVVGIAASGRTPFTVAAVQYAGSRGTVTVAVTCVENSPLERVSDFSIVTPVGPEVVTGSSRMKAGTAQKMVLNMLSTGTMARLGYVYDNLMINVNPKNSKLTERAISILRNLAGVSRSAADAALASSGKSVPVALLMLKTGKRRSEAERLLSDHQGDVRAAIEARPRPER